MPVVAGAVLVYQTAVVAVPGATEAAAQEAAQLGLTEPPIEAAVVAVAATLIVAPHHMVAARAAQAS